MFGVHDTFLDEFFGVSLFIMRRERGGGTTACAADGFAQFRVGAIARSFRIFKVSARVTGTPTSKSKMLGSILKWCENTGPAGAMP